MVHALLAQSPFALDESTAYRGDQSHVPRFHVAYQLWHQRWLRATAVRLLRGRGARQRKLARNLQCEPAAIRVVIAEESQAKPRRWVTPAGAIRSCEPSHPSARHTEVYWQSREKHPTVVHS